MQILNLYKQYKNTKKFQQQLFIEEWAQTNSLLESYNQNPQDPNTINDMRSINEQISAIMADFFDADFFNPFILFCSIISFKFRLTIDHQSSDIFPSANQCESYTKQILEKFDQKLQNMRPSQNIKSIIPTVNSFDALVSPAEMLKMLFGIICISCNLFNNDEKFTYNIDLKIFILTQIQKILIRCTHNLTGKTPQEDNRLNYQVDFGYLSDRNITDKIRSIYLIWDILRLGHETKMLQIARKAIKAMNPDGITGKANWDILPENASLILLHDIFSRLEWVEFEKNTPTSSLGLWILNLLYSPEYFWSYFLLSCVCIATTILIFIMIK